MTLNPNLHSVPSNFSKLPPEIVILIFQEGCRGSFAFALSLSQTATWTRQLALPELYSTIIIRNFPLAYSMSRTLQKPAAAFPYYPPFIPAPHVRQLWIGPASRETLTLFQICDNISHLAVDVNNLFWLLHASSNPDDISFASTRAAIESKRDMELLIFNAGIPRWHGKKFHVLPPAEMSPLFSKIHRIWVGKMGGYDSDRLDLTHFPRLTHIAIPYHNPSSQRLESLHQILEHPAIICVVVVFLSDLLPDEEYEDGLRWVAETRKVHPKVFVVPMLYKSIWEHWEENLLPGRSVWDKAAAFTGSLDMHLEPQSIHDEG